MKQTVFTALLCVFGSLALWAQTNFYYQPATGFCGDPMPFYDTNSSLFRIYYLQEYRPNAAETYHPVFAIETNDLVRYSSLGEVLPTGTKDDDDAAIGTGSVIFNEKDNTYYLFYTGNSYSPYSGSKQCVQYATSTDGIHWVKNDFRLRASYYGYSDYDFRDPEVFLGEDNRFHMLVSTRNGEKGELVEFTSDNLRTWAHQGVFMTAMWDRFFECPNVFKMGDYWYLVYSEMHKEIRRVQYFKATTLEGLKNCTKNDTPLWPDGDEGYLDSRAFYAGKTASDGTNRYIWGWCPTRKNENNTAVNNTNGEPDWAGTLVAHRIIQHEDGTLSIGKIAEIEDYFNTEESTPASFDLTAGQYRLLPALSEQNHLSFTITTEGNTDLFGISVARDEASPKYYSVRVNAVNEDRRKMLFAEEGAQGAGEIAYTDGVVFPSPTDKTYHVDVFIDHSVFVMYINDQTGYTNRIYGMSSRSWSINCYSGAIHVSNLRQRVFTGTLPLPEWKLFPANYSPAEHALGYTGASCLFISKERFQNAQAGEIIRIYGQLTGNDKHAFQIGEWTPDDQFVTNHLPGSEFREINQLPADIYLTPEMLKTIRDKNKDFRLYGEGVTVNKIDRIVPGKKKLPDKGLLLWTGYFWMNNWSTIQLYLDGLAIDWSQYKEMIIYHEANRTNYVVNILSQFGKDEAKVPETAISKQTDRVVVDLTMVDMNAVINAADEQYRDLLKIQMDKQSGGAFNITDIVLLPKDGSATTITSTASGDQAVKALRNGQVLILRDGKTYNTLGVEVK